MNRYKLVNENRAKEFINSLKLIKTENLVKLEKILEPIKQAYFGKTPSLNMSIVDWEKKHLENGWNGSEKRTFSDEKAPWNDLAPECFTEFSFDGEKNHSYSLFEYRFERYSSLKKRLDNLDTHIETLEKMLTKNHESLNEFLGDDTLTFVESIFTLIGLNPISLKTINVIVSNNIEAEGHQFFEFIDEALLETKEYRRLKKAPSLINNQTFIFYDKIYTKRLISWSIEKGFIENIGSHFKDEQIDLNENENETEILNRRLRIYKETLPNYLYSSDNPLSIRELTVATDGTKTYEYYESIKNWIGGISAEVVRKDIGRLFKSSWWKKQPKELQDKIKKK